MIQTTDSVYGVRSFLTPLHKESDPQNMAKKGEAKKLEDVAPGAVLGEASDERKIVVVHHDIPAEDAPGGVVLKAGVHDLPVDTAVSLVEAEPEKARGAQGKGKGR